MTRVLALNVQQFKTVQLLLVSAAFFILFSLVFPAPARAAVLTDVQVKAVTDLLVSYDVDSKTIEKIEKELRKEQRESKPALKVKEVAKEEVTAKYQNMLADTIVRFVNAFTGVRLDSPSATISTAGNGTLSIPIGTSTIPAGRYKLQATSSGDPAVVYATSNTFIVKGRVIKPTPTVKAPTCSLKASDTNVQAGKKVTIYWASSNASSATKTGEHNVERGYVLVMPTETTIYQKTFTGAGGSVTCEVTVTVKDTDNEGTPPTEIVQVVQSTLAQAVSSAQQSLAAAWSVYAEALSLK